MYDGKDAGIYVFAGGKGVFQGCDIFRNTDAGVAVKDGGDPTIKNCRIHDGKYAGIMVYDRGKGTFEGNTLYQNAKGAWLIKPTAGEFRRAGNSPNQ